MRFENNREKILTKRRKKYCHKKDCEKVSDLTLNLDSLQDLVNQTEEKVVDTLCKDVNSEEFSVEDSLSQIFCCSTEILCPDFPSLDYDFV